MEQTDNISQETKDLFLDPETDIKEVTTTKRPEGVGVFDIFSSDPEKRKAAFFGESKADRRDLFKLLKDDKQFAEEFIDVQNEKALRERDERENSVQNQTFDLVTVGFGLRNFTDKERGLKEMRRVLKPNGVLLILEFSKPTNSFFSKIYDWYSFNIIPKLGSFLANDSESYQYLAESIRMHPDQETLKDMVLDAGFDDCKFYNLVNGVVSIHKAK